MRSIPCELPVRQGIGNYVCAELTATTYDATGNPVGTFTYWPAGATNIGVGVNYAFGFFLCNLSIPGDQVVTVEVVVSGATAY